MRSCLPLSETKDPLFQKLLSISSGKSATIIIVKESVTRKCLELALSSPVLMEDETRLRVSLKSMDTPRGESFSWSEDLHTQPHQFVRGWASISTYFSEKNWPISEVR